MVSRRIVFTAVLALALLWTGRTAAVHAQAPTTSSIDAAFKHAFLAGDLDGMFSHFAPDAVATEPFGIFTSSAAAKAGTATFFQQNPGLSASAGDSVISLNTAIHRVAVASDPIRAAGVSRIWVIHTLVIFQGKIVAFGAVLDLSDAETATYATAMAGGH